MNKIKIVSVALGLFLGTFLIASSALLSPSKPSGLLSPTNQSVSPFTVGSSTLSGDGTQSTLFGPLLINGLPTVSSSIVFSYKSISTSTTATSSSFFNGVTSTSTITLPSATSSKGLILIFKDTTGITPTSTIILQTPTSSQVIDSTSTLTLTTKFQTVRLFSDGLNWYQW